MPKRYTITINIAVPGTPIMEKGAQKIDDNNNPVTSAAGHMWYSISDGSDKTSYGFAPIKSGTRGPGEVTTDDDEHYYMPLYSRTIEITEEQYNKLQAFGQSAIDGNNKDFDLYYHGAKNSCIDFTWKALKHADLDARITTRDVFGPTISDKINGAKKVFGQYEGTLAPKDNIIDIQSIKAPFPKSKLNTEVHNPPPKQTFPEKLIESNQYVHNNDHIEVNAPTVASIEGKNIIMNDNSTIDISQFRQSGNIFRSTMDNTIMARMVPDEDKFEIFQKTGNQYEKLCTVNAFSEQNDIMITQGKDINNALLQSINQDRGQSV